MVVHTLCDGDTLLQKSLWRGLWAFSMNFYRLLDQFLIYKFLTPHKGVQGFSCWCALRVSIP